jgi:hypothetical protein
VGGFDAVGGFVAVEVFEVVGVVVGVGDVGTEVGATGRLVARLGEPAGVRVAEGVEAAPVPLTGGVARADTPAG